MAAALALAAGWWLVRGGSPAGVDARPVLERIWVVDAGLATRYPQIGRGIRDAGGSVLVFDFPGATLPNGNRYVWVRDYGPLAMPSAEGGWIVWDARSGGSATAELEHQALPRLASAFGVPYRSLDLEVQGGNWLPLPDGRVITSRRFFEDNRELGSRAEIADLLGRTAGVRGLIEIAPMPGELTQHADMVVAVEPGSGAVLVARVWQQAIDLVPRGEEWDMYRELATAARDSLDRTAQELARLLGDERVHRLPQPLPYLERHPVEDRYRPSYPSFVNGVFVIDAQGGRTYLYGLAGDVAGEHSYSFDAPLVAAYRDEVDRVARELGFIAAAVDTGDLIRNGGSLHCATVECSLDRRRGTIYREGDSGD